MASHSTREGKRPSSLPNSSTRSREALRTNGPRRMALSDPERAHGSARVEGESKGKTPAPGTEPCFVYILKCADGSYYVGSTTDLAERERFHNEGLGAAYTASVGPSGLCIQKPTNPGLPLASARPSSSAGRVRRRTPSSRGTDPSFTNSRDAGAVDLVRSPTFRRRTDRHRFSWGCRSGLAGCSLVSADVDINRRFGPWSRSRRMYR